MTCMVIYDYPNPTAAYMHKMDLVTAYDDSLTRLQPVEIRFTGEVGALLPAFDQAYLHHTPPVDVGRYTQILARRRGALNECVSKPS